MADDLISWVESQLKIRGISQRELAKKANVSHALISNALRGERQVTWDFCKAISKGLNEPIWNVLIMARFLNDVPQEIAKSEEIRTLILKFNELNSENRRDVVKYIDWVLIRQNEKAR